MALALASLAPVKAGTLAAGAPDSGAARVRIEATDDGYHAWADNPLPGPIEVMLRYRKHHNTTASPALPARATLRAGGSTVVSVFRATDASRAVDFDLILDSVPGHPSARPRDVTYLLPLLKDARVAIDQGFAGSFSHDDDENRYAIDFAVPEGTAVLAARDGTVMQIQDGFLKPGQNRRSDANQSNFIRILHDDGSMALYAHLQPGGVVAQLGQHVRTGQHIGWSGNTGFSTGPHLHFAVQVNRGMRLVSLPFRMEQVEMASGPRVWNAPAVKDHQVKREITGVRVPVDYPERSFVLQRKGQPMSSICPLCESGSLKSSQSTEPFNYAGFCLEIRGYAFSVCASCGAETVLPGQARVNERLMADAKRQHDGLLVSS